MLTPRRAAGPVLLLLLSLLGWNPRARAQAPAPDSSIVLAHDPHQFRAQMIDFLQRTEAVLAQGMEHPLLGERIALALNAHLLELPLQRDVYLAFESATPDELQRMRDALAGAPDFLSIPQILESALVLVPEAPQSAEAATCGNNYEEWNSVVAKTSVVRGLTIGYDTTGFVYSIFNTITEVAGATTEDTAYVGKIPSIPFIVVRGILGVVQQSIGFARSDIGYQINLHELCLASCLSDDGDVHGEPSKFLRGRGCDNRDNNCADGIDDGAEDLFPPSVSFDAALIASCFRDLAGAQAAAELAVEATDDCSDPTTSVALGPVSSEDCRTPVTVTARDRSSNLTTLTGGGLALTVDGQAPQVTPATLDACYPSMEAARAVFAGPGLSIADCTSVSTQVEAVEKECVAEFQLAAVDACGNQTTIRDTVRVDGTAPEVDVRRLLVPAVDGLACFATQNAAVQAVHEATVVSDNCTLPEDLVRATTLSGDACNLEIRQSATDQCGRNSSDALTVRVDAAPPVVSCAVATSVLYPASDQMVDVGFTYQASDNCEPEGPQLDVQVMSDEPTLYAFSIIGGADPAPDAVVERGPGGSITRILLRAQRAQTPPADGRLYRIRIVATDSCGLSSHADCFVAVPRTNPGPGSAVNSGLDFDAAVGN